MSQILIIIIYLNIKKTISADSAVASILFILLNPYLIISSRNISAVYNYEFYAAIFIFLLVRRNSSKNLSFLYGFISSISFAIYFPFLIYTTVVNIVLLIKDKYKNIKYLSLGYVSGILGNIVLFLPVINDIKLENISSSTSWGVSSFWRISIQFLSGNSLKNKINNDIDLNILNNEFPLYSTFHEINLIVILLLLVLSLIKLVKNIQINSVDDFDLIFISIVIFAGIIFTVINRPLYPHYYFLFGIFSYIFLFKNIKNLKILFLVCLVYSFSSIFVVLNFHNFIALNDGASNSDYGKTYESCGKFVKDARECRGQ